MKTIREWLETLPEPYKGQALANATSDGLLEVDHHDTLYDALAGAFFWESSPEGDDYWRTVAEGKVLPYAGQIEPPTNALSALHAIAAKEGIAVENIMSVRPEREDESNGCCWYYTIRHTMIETFVDLSNDK